MFYATFSHKRSARAAMLVFALAVFIAVFITAYYYHIKDPLFHQNAFALLTAVVFFRNLYGMEISLRPSRQARRRAWLGRGRANVNSAAEQTRMDQRDLGILKTMYQMIPVGLGSIALGFLIWNVDNEFWIAQFFNLTWSIWLRYCFDGQQDQVELVWPTLFTSVPLVERLDKQKSSTAQKKKA
ncbi:MAG: hypothetical protein Q9168_005854 [Polycauliona sp. 1 TL-2023]